MAEIICSWKTHERDHPLFIRLISCWKTPQHAGNSLSELQEIQNFQWGMPPDPSRRHTTSVLDSVVSES
jgi:hypothetical protein